MYTLLIADDEADERTLIRFLLNDFRNTFHILEAQNGRDALELLTNNHVDILLSDIQMPFLSGIELVSQVKEKNPDIEVLFFSGYDDFSYVKAALSLKAVNYILKPVDPDEFHKVLTEIVDRLDSHKIEFSNQNNTLKPISMILRVMLQIKFPHRTPLMMPQASFCTKSRQLSEQNKQLNYPGRYMRF